MLVRTTHMVLLACCYIFFIHNIELEFVLIQTILGLSIYNVLRVLWNYRKVGPGVLIVLISQLHCHIQQFNKKTLLLLLSHFIYLYLSLFRLKKIQIHQKRTNNILIFQSWPKMSQFLYPGCHKQGSLNC